MLIAQRSYVFNCAAQNSSTNADLERMARAKAEMTRCAKTIH
jgi:hypothetical protein